MSVLYVLYVPGKRKWMLKDNYTIKWLRCIGHVNDGFTVKEAIYDAGYELYRAAQWSIECNTGQ